MGVSCKQVTFITVSCDLCRVVEHRSHEAKQDGDMGSFLRSHEEQAVNSLPAGWVRTKHGERKFVCPTCTKQIHKACG